MCIRPHVVGQPFLIDHTFSIKLPRLYYAGLHCTHYSILVDHELYSARDYNDETFFYVHKLYIVSRGKLFQTI